MFYLSANIKYGDLPRNERHLVNKLLIRNALLQYILLIL